MANKTNQDNPHNMSSEPVKEAYTLSAQDAERLYNEIKEQMGITVLRPTVSVSDIAKKHGVSIEYVENQLKKGAAIEHEHLGANVDNINAESIALHHLDEDIEHYKVYESNQTEQSKSASDVHFGSGGQIKHVSGNAGGYLVGHSHANGGIKAINKSNGQHLEMEGGEVVITKNAVNDPEKREFEGKMMTNREILSHINESGGGVSFEEGGEIQARCACDSRSYTYKGSKMEMGAILADMNQNGDEYYQREYMHKMLKSYKSKHIPRDLSIWLAHSELVYAQIPHTILYGGFMLNDKFYGGYPYIQLIDGTIIDYYADMYLQTYEENPVAPTGWGRIYHGAEINISVLSLEEMADLLSSVALRKKDTIVTYVKRFAIDGLTK